MTPAHPVGRAVRTAAHRAAGTALYAAHRGADALGARLPGFEVWDARRGLGRLRRIRDRWAALDARPDSWSSFEERRWSQNGEDGLIAELVRRVGAPGRWFVEIGASDGAENCTRALAEAGWTGLWVEADPERVRVARGHDLAGVTVAEAFARRASISSLLDDFDVPAEPDVLVVDIDGDDLGVLESVLRHRRPRIVVVEYNAAYPPPASWALPERRADGWDGTDRFGASLQALVDAAVDHRLVVCDSTGVNAFFVRSDLAPLVPLPASVRAAYRPAAFSRHPGGHVRDREAVRAPGPGEPITLEDARGVTLAGLRPEGPVRVRPGGTVGLSVEVRNGGSVPLRSGGPGGCSLVLRWVDDDEPPPPDAARTPLAHAIPPGGTRRVVLWMPAPPDPGPHRLRVTAVVEGVAWLDVLGGDGRALDLDVVVA